MLHSAVGKTRPVKAYKVPAGTSLVLQQKSIYLQCRSCRRCGFNPWVRKIPWTRKWQPAPVFLPRQSHGGYSPPGLQRAGQDWMTACTCPTLGGLDAARRPPKYLVGVLLHPSMECGQPLS